MYFFVTSGMSYRNYCDSNVFGCYFSRELFPDASLALSEGSWGRLPSLCVPYHNLRSSWLFLVSNISCSGSKRFLYRAIRPSRFGRFSGKLRPSPHYAGGIWKLSESFPLKMHQMFSVHTTPEEFGNAAITEHFAFVFEENSLREITWLLWRHRSRKAPFWKCFPYTRKRKPGIFAGISPVWGVFSKRWISMDGFTNCSNKAVFPKHGPGSMDHPMDPVHGPGHGPPHGPGPWTQPWTTPKSPLLIWKFIRDQGM